MSEEAKTPKVVSLNTAQWKAVVLNDIAMLHQGLQGITAPSEQDIANIDAYILNTRGMMHGWRIAGAHAAAQAAAAQAAQVNVAAEPQAQPVAPAAETGNGAAPPKRKGGWQKGRKRNAPAPAAQQ